MRSCFCTAVATALVALAGCHGGSAADEPAPGGGPDGGAGIPAGPPTWLGVTGERLAALPPPSSTRTDLFATNDVCAQCHLAGTDTALRDAKGRDVSPVGTWRSSPMALAARDPFYLATVADELQHRPSLTKKVEATCTRCHAPEAALELEPGLTTPTFAMLTAEVSPNGDLAREAIGCTLCHQVQAAGLGTAQSFSGGFTVGSERQIFGPYLQPATDPMRTLVNYTPMYGEQIRTSALCGTCHTVITRALDANGGEGREFVEQATYFEWLASAYTNEGVPGSKPATCQDCHMAAVDLDGAPLETAIATYPKNLPKRKPFWRHGFVGGNVLLSRLAASDPTWVGAPVSREGHEAQAAASEAMLRTAAKVAVEGVKRDGESVAIAVRVTNQTGHKLPTGYPTRRAWLHVRVVAPDGGVVFESGRTDAYGRLVGRGDVLAESPTFAPHLDVVEREEQVQIYEAVPVDAAGKVARRALDAHHFAKDNRLLPEGYDPKNRWSVYTPPIGTTGDPSFDVVTYRVAKVPAGATITVRLLHQTARPRDLEALAAEPTPVARKLFDMATAAPPLPSVLAEATSTAP